VAFKAKIAGREELMRRLERITPGVTEAAAEAKLEAVKEAANLISADAPHKTGEYMESIQGDFQKNRPGITPVGGRKSKDPDAVGVYAPWYWRFLEFGTAPHKIKAKSKPALVFRDGGPIIVAEEVMHPGSRAQPHVFPTWKEYKPKAKRKIAKAVNDAVKRSLGK
jgi:HK97 gp10 family phage protein